METKKTFIETAQDERKVFAKAYQELWLAHNPQERVAIENLLIMYDQMVERLEKSANNIDRVSEQIGKSEKGFNWISGYLIEEIINLSCAMGHEAHDAKTEEFKEILEKYNTKLAY
jgi:hypothetical protein